MIRKTGEAGIAIIKSFESLHDGDLSVIGLQPKMDPVGIWTEGWGHAILYKGQHLKGIENKNLAYELATVSTEAEANQFLTSDLIPREDALNSLIKVTITQNQFDAMISLLYNIGTGNFLKSSVLRFTNLKQFDKAANSFKLFNKAGGKVLLGLVRRRQAEKELFLKADEQKENIVWIEKHTKPKPMDILFPIYKYLIKSA